MSTDLIFLPVPASQVGHLQRGGAACPSARHAEDRTVRGAKPARSSRNTARGELGSPLQSTYYRYARGRRDGARANSHRPDWPVAQAEGRARVALASGPPP